MKKIGFLTVFVILFLIGNLVFSQELGRFKTGSEPGGFRGIPWGTDITTLRDMKYLTNDDQDSRIYVRRGDELRLGEAQLSRIEYKFWTGAGRYGTQPVIFYGVYIESKGKDNWRKFKEAMFDLFGKGLELSPEWYGWNGRRTSAIMSYSNETNITTFLMEYEEIINIRRSIKKQSEKDKKLK